MNMNTIQDIKRESYDNQGELQLVELNASESDSQASSIAELQAIEDRPIRFIPTKVLLQMG